MSSRQTVQWAKCPVTSKIIQRGYAHKNSSAKFFQLPMPTNVRGPNFRQLPIPKKLWSFIFAVNLLLLFPAHKRPSPLFYTYPQKTSFNDNRQIPSCYHLINFFLLNWVQLNHQTGSAIICPTHKPCCVPMPEMPFINADKPFNGCQQSTHKY